MAGSVGIGFERTRQQDVAIGIRQLVDVACKALSPAVNDPYTAVQAVDHLAVIFSELGRRRLGTRVARDVHGLVSTVVPSRRFGDYLGTMCGLIRRYGASEPTVALALLHLLEDWVESVESVESVGSDQERLDDIADQARLVLADAERDIVQPADSAAVRSAADRLQQAIGRSAEISAGSAAPLSGTARQVAGPREEADALDGAGAWESAARGSRSARVSGWAGGRSRIVTDRTSRAGPTCSSSPGSTGRQPGSSSIRSLATTTAGRSLRSPERTRTVPAALA